jgi:dihydroxy-acid dehydratase
MAMITPRLITPRLISPPLISSAPYARGLTRASSRISLSACRYKSSKPRGLRAGLTNYGDPEFSLFLRKAFIKGAGYTDWSLSKLIIGIINTHSSFNPCHGNVPTLIENIKHGVLSTGIALPMEFPTISLHESFSFPTSMYLRNLMSMDTEEMIRDKTVPAQLMGALSADIPAIQIVTGPMLTGSHRGTTIGACTDCRKYWAKFRAGEIDQEEIDEVNDELVPSVGTCGVMGTASTMACITEALGIAPLGSASPPAVSSARVRVAERTGVLAVSLAKNHLTPRQILKRENFENAVRVLQAIGGSTNGIVHLLSVAGRVPDIDLTLDDIDRIGRDTPLLVDLKPSGENYMVDFHRAGGVPRLLHEIKHLLHLDTLTITGRTLRQELDKFDFRTPQSIVKPFNTPLFPNSSLAVVKGNLAPDGAVIKQSAATPNLLKHSGPAVVFRNSKDLAERIDDENLNVNPTSVLVLQNIGPKGGPGMPEAGLIPIPKKLARIGVKDMLRISDGRMSGTAAGTIILHVAPEAGVGGTLAAVRDGDIITLDLSTRSISLEVSEEEIERRLGEGGWEMKEPARGYAKLYHNHVQQANFGCDFDFLREI